MGGSKVLNLAQALLNVFLGLWLYFEYMSSVYMREYVDGFVAVYSLPIAMGFSAAIAGIVVGLMRRNRAGRAVLRNIGPKISRRVRLSGVSQGSQAGEPVGPSQGEAVDEASVAVQRVTGREELSLPGQTAQSLESSLLDQIRALKERLLGLGDPRYGESPEGLESQLIVQIGQLKDKLAQLTRERRPEASDA